MHLWMHSLACSSAPWPRPPGPRIAKIFPARDTSAPAVLLQQSFAAGLGHASYLVADPDAGVAFLVDPDRQIDAYLGAASRLGVLITDSFETHVHNDYVSGSRALAEIRPIAVHTGEHADVEYPHEAHPDESEVSVGELHIRCLATPGHTPEHVAYLGSDLRRADDPHYLFSA